MAKPLTTIGDVLEEGERMLGALTVNAADLTDLQPYRSKLDALVENLQELMTRQGTLTSEKQDVSKDLRGALDQCAKLIVFLRNGVKEHYGTRSEKLKQFGVQPFRSRKPAPQEITPPPVPTIE